MKLLLNPNGRVTVRLTDRGLRALDEHEADVGIPSRHRRLSISDGNLWTGQLWSLMQEIGNSCRIGFDSPFVDNRIEYEDP